jgi:hypothetical protein
MKKPTVKEDAKQVDAMAKWWTVARNIFMLDGVLGARAGECIEAVITSLEYAYPQRHEPGHLGLRKKKIE